MPVLTVPAARDLIRSALTGSAQAPRHAHYFTEAILDTTERADAAQGAVDLDTEAARLLELQQSYQASAQIMTVEMILFEILREALADTPAVLIHGPRQSGKTTLARLISGLYQPSQGAVLVDGTDIRQIDPAELRRQIADGFEMLGPRQDLLDLAARESNAGGYAE